MSAGAADRPAMRLLKRLASRTLKLLQDESGYYFEGEGRRTRALDATEIAAVARLRSDGLIGQENDGRVMPSKVGRRLLVRMLSGADGFAAQHQNRGPITTTDPDGGLITAMVNHDESPLSRLRRHKGRDGLPFINVAEFTAGDRIRTDYERGQLRPRVTANWTASVAAGRRSGSSGGIAELTDAALSARQRVDAALRGVGPESAGLLVDFCCFLKGLEGIEAERRLSPRTGKFLVRVGLAQLARHYGLSSTAEGPDWSRRLVHWGTDDYRPQIDG